MRSSGASCGVIVADVARSCSGRIALAHHLEYRQLRGSCSRDPAVLLGRGDDLAAPSPTIVGAHHAPIEARRADTVGSGRTTQTDAAEPARRILPMISITKRRLVSLVSASAMIATMAVATPPAATLAAKASPSSQGRDPHGQAPQSHVTSHRVGRRVRLRHRCLLRARPDRNRDRRNYGAKHYGVVADGANVNVTGSKVHDIGDKPFSSRTRVQRHAVRPCHRLLQRR